MFELHSHISIMQNGPVKPRLHGIIDYAFSAIMLAAPTVLPFNKKTSQTYQAGGTAFLLMNAATDTPVALKPLLHFKEHQTCDAVFLSAMTLMAATPMIRKNKTMAFFHIGFLTLAAAHYLLTDYNARAEAGCIST